MMQGYIVCQRLTAGCYWLSVPAWSICSSRSVALRRGTVLARELRTSLLYFAWQCLHATTTGTSWQLVQFSC